MGGSVSTVNLSPHSCSSYDCVDARIPVPRGDPYFAVCTLAVGMLSFLHFAAIAFIINNSALRNSHGISGNT